MNFSGPINVRKEEDIELIARELFNLHKNSLRGEGLA